MFLLIVKNKLRLQSSPPVVLVVTDAVLVVGFVLVDNGLCQRSTEFCWEEGLIFTFSNYQLFLTVFPILDWTCAPRVQLLCWSCGLINQLSGLKL